jgi:broad-specificity NMP kinase
MAGMVTGWVLLTGMSGVGKSSVVRALRRMGFTAIDMDEPGWSARDREGNLVWCEDRLWAALAVDPVGPGFVSGCAENQVRFYPQFTHIVLLSAPGDVIRQRLATRPDNPYGKRPEELAEVLHHLELVEPSLRRSATHEIVTTIPFEGVVAQVLAIATGASRGGAPAGCPSQSTCLGPERAFPRFVDHLRGTGR